VIGLSLAGYTINPQIIAHNRINKYLLSGGNILDFNKVVIPEKWAGEKLVYIHPQEVQFSNQMP